MVLTDKFQKTHIHTLVLERIFEMGILSERMSIAERDDNCHAFTKAFLEYVDIKRELRGAEINSDIIDAKFTMIEIFAEGYLGKNAIASYKF